MRRCEWAAVLHTGDGRDKRDALLMLADEDWLDDEGGEFFREAASRGTLLAPAYSSDGTWFWRDRGIRKDFDTWDSCDVPPWVIDRLGRVDGKHRQGTEGCWYSVSYDTPLEAYERLLRAMTGEHVRW